MQDLKVKIRQDPFAAFEGINAGILITDRNHNILFINKSLLNYFNITPDNVNGKTCGQLLHPKQLKCLDCQNHPYKSIRLEIDGRSYNILVHSSLFLKNWSIKIIQDTSKVLSSLSDVSDDVTELKRIMKETFKTKNFRIICCECKMLKMPDGSWRGSHNIEQLKASRTLSHGLCPRCATKHLTGLADFRKFKEEGTGRQ